MRTSLLVTAVVMLQMSSHVLSQKDTNVYNAYTMAKDLVLMDGEVSAGKNPLQIDPARLQRNLKYMVWYADLQDLDRKAQLDTLITRLGRYPRLVALYRKIYGVILDTIGLLSVTPSQIESTYNDIFINAPKIKATLSGLYGTIQLYTDKINKLIEDTTELDKEISNFKTLASNEQLKLTELENKLKELTDTSLLRETIIFESAAARRLKEELDRKVIKNTELREKNKNDRITAEARLKKANNDLLAYFKINEEDPTVIRFIQRVNKLDISQTFIERYNNNPEIEKEIRLVQEYKEAIINEASSNSLQFKLPNQTEIIDAIAIYLAKRVKQEAVMWFFETIKKNASQYELIQTFFPNTITLLQSNEVYEIPNLGSQWRYALSKDFVKLPRNVFTSEWFKKWFAEKTGDNGLLLEYLNAGFDIGDLLVQRYSYRNLVKQLYLQLSNANDNSPNKKLIKPRDIFSLLYAINEECFLISHKDTSYRLLQFEDLRTMNKDELEIMFSLMDMKYGRSISRFFDAATTKNFVIEQQDVNSVRRWLGGIETGIKQFEKIQDDFNKTQEEIKNGKKEDAVFSLFNLWESVNALFDLVIPDTLSKPAWMNGLTQNAGKVKLFTKMGFEVYNQITLSNYAGAVNTTISIIEELFYYNDKKFTISDGVFKERLVVVKNKRKDRYITQYPEIVNTGIRKDTPAAMKKPEKDIEPTGKKTGISQNDTVKLNQANSLHHLKRTDTRAAILFERDRHAINLIRKLAGFLNDVMLTTDSKKLAKVVESYALPPGSYKRKRNSWWSLDLNAFVGAHAGYEIARKDIDPFVKPLKSKGYVYGITAPIGLSLSKTFGRRLRGDSVSESLIRNPDKLRIAKKSLYQRGNATFTITAFIIDIGAVVSYRFNNTADSVLPQDVKWAQLFSPGIQLAYGFRNTPLVISAGYQYTPQLRKIDEQPGDSKNRQYNANRFQLALMFDLPLANIWQRSFYGPKMHRVKNKPAAIRQ